MLHKSIVLRRPLAVKPAIWKWAVRFVPPAHFIIHPFTIRRMIELTENEAMGALIMREMVEPQGLYSRFMRHWCGTAIGKAIGDMMVLSMPDDKPQEADEGKGGKVKGVVTAICQEAAFIPSLMLALKVSVDEVLDMTMRDAVFFAESAALLQDHERDISELALHSRFNMGLEQADAAAKERQRDALDAIKILKAGVKKDV